VLGGERYPGGGPAPALFGDQMPPGPPSATPWLAHEEPVLGQRHRSITVPQKNRGWKEHLEGSGQISAPGKAKFRVKHCLWPRAVELSIGQERRSQDPSELSPGAAPRSPWFVFPNAASCLHRLGLPTHAPGLPCKHPKSWLYCGTRQSLWFLPKQEENFRPAHLCPVNPFGTINLPSRG